MIPKECKRIAEVDFPIAAVSRHAVREKSSRHGHLSTLHLWWARRPLASSRAVLMALLLPDPCDPHCPETFKDEARKILLGMHGRKQGWNKTTRTEEGLRRVILQFIADFANWDVAANQDYLEVGRALVTAAHGEAPPPHRGSVRGRRLDPAGGAPGRMRGVRERPQSRSVLHPQSIAGGNSAARASNGRRTPPHRTPNQGDSGERAGEPLPEGPRWSDSNRVPLGSHGAL